MGKYPITFREQETRQNILMLLKKRGSSSVQELSESLKITKVAVRKHLDVLHRDRYVDCQLQRREIGRPIYVYDLTDLADRLFPRHYSEFATELIDEIVEVYGDSYVNLLFDRRMTRTLHAYQKAIAGQDFEKRCKTLASLQDSEGYMVTLEKSSEGSYSLEQANCPVSQVAARFRQSCQCELTLFTTLLDAHVERTHCMAEGQTKCRYLITEREGYAQRLQ
ncbi:helix-turn-helix transcriptional regulator [Brevibacillus reuszeri]|uniref:helix-turn-helix transcriptional regulator n=1 Tax=Brevibacillus reuszeri TaxID=54915 RepID=UPI00289C5A34|nr:metalloregulator ArsR/SmtB family transcription factor [Brevibacillus reuszeri]